MALISCPKCGAKISDKAPKCPKCGYVKLSEAEQPSNYEVEESLSDFSEEQSSGKVWKIATISLIILIILGIGGVLVYHNGNSTNSFNNSTAETDTTCVEIKPILEDGYHCWKLSSYNYFGDELICEVSDSRIKRAYIGVYPFDAKINDNTLSGNVAFPNGGEIYIIVNYETGECWSDKNIKKRADFLAYKITPPTDTIISHFKYRERDWKEEVSEYERLQAYQDVAETCDSVPAPVDYVIDDEYK